MYFITMGFERRGEWAKLPQAEQQRRIRKHQEGLSRLYAERVAAAQPHLSMSVGLHDSATETVVRYDGTRAVVTDGPFTESKEVLAGFDLINFDSREQAIAWQQSLGFDHEGHVTELRGVQGASLFLYSHRPTTATKYLMLFAKNPRLGVLEMHNRAGTEYVMKGFADESICLASARLAEPAEARTLRVRGGKSIVSDGPFAEGREVIGGLVVLDCVTHESALEWAQRFTEIEDAVTEVIPCAMWYTHSF
jgi:hypothetical protein